MKVITDLNFQLNNSAVCIGKFDGIHRGHRLLLQEAKQSGLTLVMFTFQFPNAQVLYSDEEKRHLAERLGVDILVAIPVTKDFLQIDAATFTKEILVEKCDAKKVVVGSDFCFGYQRKGDAAFLAEQGDKLGFEVCVFEKLKEKGEIISSTRIRRKLLEGELQEVNDLLQTPYFIRGTVEEGNRIGRKMEVPTANIRPAEGKELPPFGVYAVRVDVNGTVYDGIGNLGIKPTIPGENEAGLEVWLFDYEGDLYGQTLTVYLVAYQRPEKRFDSLEQLKKQIGEDTIKAREILQKVK